MIIWRSNVRGGRQAGPRKDVEAGPRKDREAGPRKDVEVGRPNRISGEEADDCAHAVGVASQCSELETLQRAWQATPKSSMTTGERYVIGFDLDRP